MTDILISGTTATFNSTVTGEEISPELLTPAVEVIDELTFFLHTEMGSHCISVEDYTVNGQTFNSSETAVSFIQNL